MGQIPPRVKDPNFILGQTYVSNDESSLKCWKACEACGETPKIRNPNKHTGFNKIQMNIGGLSDGLSHWVKHQGLVFTLGICMCEGVDQDLGYGHEESHLMHDMKYFI